MPFRMKRAKALVTLLQKEPSAAWVSRDSLEWNQADEIVLEACRSDC